MSRLQSSQLYDQTTFYGAFLRDLQHALRRVVIESPFISKKRIAMLLPSLQRLSMKCIRVVINTKPIEEHE